MLFPRNALASGPQACFGAQKGLPKVKVGKLFLTLDIFFCLADIHCTII
jgi:hypothetical protein